MKDQTDSDSDDSKNSSKNLGNYIKRIPFIGYISIILSTFFLAFMGVFVKLLKDDFNPIQTLLMSYAVCSVFYFNVNVHSKTHFTPASGETRVLVGRCFFGFATSFCLYTSLTLIPLGDGTAIFQSTPVYVTTIAYFYLRETCTTLQIILLFVNIFGVILIVKPSFAFTKKTTSSDTNAETIGYFFANIGAVTSAFLLIALRRLKLTPSTVTVFWFSFSVVMFSTTYLIVRQEFRVPKNSKHLLFIFLNSLCVIAAQQLMTFALKVEKAGPISMVRSVQVVFSYLDQKIVLNEKIDIISLLGAVVICSTVAILGFQSWLSSSSSESVQSLRGLNAVAKTNDKQPKSEPKSEDKIDTQIKT